MRNGLLLALLLVVSPFASAQILTTEVWLGALEMRKGQFVVSGLKNISNEPGYDNQPAFDPDGSILLYTSEAESLSETGLGVHAVRYSLETGIAEPLVKARGFSPTPIRENSDFMTLREGTVWLHDAAGNPLRVMLPHVKTAGYFTRLDTRHWVVFLNVPERWISLWDESELKLSSVRPNAVTGPVRIGQTKSVTFVIEENDSRKLVLYDVHGDGGGLERAIATIPFRTSGAHVWTSRNTLLMASGNAIHEWSPEVPEEWPVVHRFSDPELQGITRIALSPKEDRIALVSTPNDLAILRESRHAENKAFAESVGKHRGTSWLRTPERFDIHGDTAEERGSSVRRWNAHEVRGDYTVTWRRTITPNGTPAWTPRSEQYISR